MGPFLPGWRSAVISGPVTSIERTRTHEYNKAHSFTGILLILMLLGAGAFYNFLNVRRPVPDFSGISRSSAVNGNLLSDPSATTLQTTAVASEVTSADRAAFQQLLNDVQMAWSKT